MIASINGASMPTVESLVVRARASNGTRRERHEPTGSWCVLNKSLMQGADYRNGKYHLNPQAVVSLLQLIPMPRSGC